jgi:hypothetical protein
MKDNFTLEDMRQSHAAGAHEIIRGYDAATDMNSMMDNDALQILAERGWGEYVTKHFRKRN